MAIGAWYQTPSPKQAPIAQLDRAPVYGTGCRKFESSWARPLPDPAESPMQPDEHFIRLALAEAEQAARVKDVPVGAIVIDKRAR